MSAVLPLKESSRELIVEITRALQPYFPDISAAWREHLQADPMFTGRVMGALERLTPATGCSYFCHGDFAGFFENVDYFGKRLAKLEVDTRAVSRSLDQFNAECEPYLGRIFGPRRVEAMTAMEMLSSVIFVAVSGAYFEAKSAESSALMAVLDAELRSQELPSMLHRILELTLTTFGANVGVVMLREQNSALLRLKASVGLSDDIRESVVPVGAGFSGRIAVSGQPELLLDTSTDRHILSPTLREKARTLWGVPMTLDGKATGVLVIGFDKPYEWLPRERELMRAIADRFAMAIERARMLEALREREAMIAQLSKHLLQAQEEERTRISRELHDETGQALMVIRLYLGMLDAGLPEKSAPSRAKIAETVQVVDRTIEGIRRILGRLSPLVLKELGLEAALRKEAKDVTKSSGINTRVDICGPIPRMKPDIETSIYRVVQESLHNVVKHAGAKNVDIMLARRNGRVEFSVSDDGVGLAATKSSSRGNSFGLAGIKERVAMLGGEVRIVSAKGQGTHIDVSVPVEEEVETPARAPRSGKKSAKPEAAPARSRKTGA